MLHVVDRMIKVPDAASYTAIHFLAQLLGRKVGGLTTSTAGASGRSTWCLPPR